MRGRKKKHVEFILERLNTAREPTQTGMIILTQFDQALLLLHPHHTKPRLILLPDPGRAPLHPPARW
jgi:hypothetical protein